MQASIEQDLRRALADAEAKAVKLFAATSGRMSCGRERYWILEIHLVDRARTFGGFHQRLL